jgi:hypothetical protein
MDIYKILETLKRVEESNIEGIRINGKQVDMSSLAIADVRPKDYPDFSDAFISDGYYTDGTPISDDDLEMLTQERGDLVNELAHKVFVDHSAAQADKELDEVKHVFANPKQKPGDQVRGTEKAVSKNNEHPFKNRLVGASESVGARLLKSYADYLEEYGMTTGGTATGASAKNATTPADQAKQVAQVQQNVNKLKSAGANIPNVNQAVQSVMKDPTDPASQLDRNVSAGLGQEIDQMLTKGDPSTVNQLATLIKKVKQGT